jgi:hypothetical protein
MPVDPITNLFRDAALNKHTDLEPAHATAADWNAVRKAHPLNQILPATRRWFDSLPASCRPIEMMKTYPRIANRVAVAWREPQTAQEFINDLLLDRRGERQGFPPFVTLELMRLRSILDGEYGLQLRR